MKKEENIRKISLCTFAMFMCNNISKGYIVALIADITATISIIVALIRYRKKKPTTEQVEEITGESTETTPNAIVK
jgi:hypothetical protein